MTIWQATLDDRFDCRVERINEVHALLTVRDTTNERVLLSKEVTLAYGAAYGPDIDDVTDWQDWCVAAVDKPQ